MSELAKSPGIDLFGDHPAKQAVDLIKKVTAQQVEWNRKNLGNYGPDNGSLEASEQIGPYDGEEVVESQNKQPVKHISKDPDQVTWADRDVDGVLRKDPTED